MGTSDLPSVAEATHILIGMLMHADELPEGMYYVLWQLDDVPPNERDEEWASQFGEALKDWGF